MQTDTYTDASSLFPHVCAARFEDAFGEVESVVTIDGSSIILRVRGVDFATYVDFDFEPQLLLNEASRQQFLWEAGTYLRDFSLSFSLTVPVTSEEGTVLSRIEFVLERGSNSMAAKTTLTLHWADVAYTVSANYNELECLLNELAKLLPSGVYLRNCYNCLYSDYSPSGKSGFGDMECHRREKAAYLLVKTKQDYFRLRNVERVQETYLCPEWEKRVAGTGYRR